MFQNKILLFLLVCAPLYCVENSVIPLLDKFECVENLPQAKYSDNQYKEICNVLSHKDEKIRIASFNILFNLYDQNLPLEYRWPQRLPRVVAVIEEMQPDVLGVQELYPDMYKDLMPFMENNYCFFSNQEHDGELNGFFYKKDRFELLSSSTDPVTKIELKDKVTGHSFICLNTHFSFSKVNKREEQAREIALLVQGQSKPLFFMGDLNVFPQRLDAPGFPFYDGDYVHRLLTKDRILIDAKDVTLLGHVGPISTFTNEGAKPTPFIGYGTPGVFLDHIYVNDQVTVLIHAVQPGKVDGLFPSDHMPVVIDCILK